MLENSWTDISEIHFSLASLKEAELTASSYFTENDFQVTRGVFLKALDFFEEMIMADAPPSRAPNAAVSSPRVEVTKFPPLTLFSFSGQVLEWTLFQKVFILINGKSWLIDAERLRYLKLSIRGLAEVSIEHMPSTADGFEVAWQILVERYDNSRAMMLSSALQMLQPTAVESLRIPFLRLLRDQVVRTYKVLDRPVDQ
ncbi:hypothetical protein KM043_014469 [Ampulex compressa]|nr:hypothetical protein KM043_014469 [Ampulex compressa]